MKLIPAIDLLDGRCVRLLHGDFDQCQVYADDAADIAAAYAQAGAEWLHVVDLAASRDGASADTGPLIRLLNACSQRVQTGGGVRQRADVTARLEAGAERVVIGSLFVTATADVLDWMQELGPERIVAALDVRIDENGTPWPRIHGWTESGGIDLWTLMDQLAANGLRHALVTDISRDGALSGPNTSLYRDIVSRYPDIEVQASGGVSQLEDLAELTATGAAGAITGKALLDGRFTVAAALELLS